MPEMFFSEFYNFSTYIVILKFVFLIFWSFSMCSRMFNFYKDDKMANKSKSHSLKILITWWTSLMNCCTHMSWWFRDKLSFSSWYLICNYFTESRAYMMPAVLKNFFWNTLKPYVQMWITRNDHKALISYLLAYLWR